MEMLDRYDNSFAVEPYHGMKRKVVSIIAK
jgi:hypothetical protein